MASKAVAFGNTAICRNCDLNRENQHNTTDTQTEEMYFTIIRRLASNDAATVRVEPQANNNTIRNFSIVAHKDANPGAEDGGPLEAYEDLLIVVENLQDLCKGLEARQQISVLCAINYLRLYCGLLDDKGKKPVGPRKNRHSSKLGSSVSSNSGAGSTFDMENTDVSFWLSTFGGEEVVEEQPSRRFKKAAMAVKTAIIMAGSFKNASFVAEHVKDDSAYGFYLRENLYSWDYDPFEMDRLSSQRSISALFREIVLVSNLVNEFKLDLGKLDAFCAAMEAGYDLNRNPYHNSIHGADVLQTCFCLLSNTGIAKWLSSLELLAMLFAAMVHDVEHTGTNNIFHQKSQSTLSILYNDKSVLENHHVSVAFKTLRNPALNPFGRLSAAQFKTFRDIVIECVLATDMATHFNQVNELRSSTLVPSTIVHQDMMNTILHCADISAPAKKWELHSKWTERVMAEFFAQGDKESALGLPISPLCDRKTTSIPESQIGFITYITTPCYKVLGDAIDALLMEQQREDFFAMNGYSRRNSMVQRKYSSREHRDSVFGDPTPGSGNNKLPTLTPIEDSAPSSENLTFTYTPIDRCWDKNFVSNKAKWEEQLEADKKLAAAMATIAEESEAATNSALSFESTGSTR